MKIGFFDSGLGGLFILKSVVRRLGQYDYIYLGDTKRVPYGNRSAKTVFEFTCAAIDYLFSKNCGLIVLACNTASAQALRKIQRQYLPKKYPGKRVLGVIVPTIESVTQKNICRVGVLATQGTINSGVFPTEIKKFKPTIKIFQNPAPLLVPLVENNGFKWAEPILKEYLAPLIKNKTEVIILGCTHYPALKNQIRKIVGKKIKVVSQDEIIPKKLADYLKRHPEIEHKLNKNRKVTFKVTDLTPAFSKTAKKWFGEKIKLELVNLD